jgi:hypothetical protein
VIDFEEKKVLVWSDQDASTAGKNVVVSDELKTRMMKPWWPDDGVWKRNEWRKLRPEWRSASSFLMEKYTRRRRETMFNHLGHYGRKG